MSNNPPFQQHLVSGIIAGSVTTATLFPLDLIKVRYQVHEGKGSAYDSLQSAFRTIIKNEGFNGLYRGMTPAIIASAASWGGYFYFYEKSKKRKANVEAGEENIRKLNSIDHLLAGVEAGAIMVFITNPLWLIKTRLQLQGKDPSVKKYSGFYDAIRTIPREEGMLALYKGLVPALLLTSHGAIQFTIYEYLKSVSVSYDFSTKDSQSPFISALFGGVSKIIAAIVTYPYQVVKSRLQQRDVKYSDKITLGNQEFRHTKYLGTIDCIKKIWRYEGVPGYFKGAVANVLRVAPSAALTLLVYEECLKIL